MNIIIDVKNTSCGLVICKHYQNEYTCMYTWKPIKTSVFFILRSLINKNLPKNTRQLNRQ